MESPSTPVAIFLRSIADAAYERHRLKYIWKDGDTPDSRGDPTTLFVCICEEAFDRRGFNHHIYDKLVEVD